MRYSVEDPHTAARDELRRRWQLFWFVFAAYLPLGVVVVMLGLFDLVYFAASWMALFLIVGSRLAMFRCPSCQNRAFQRPRWRNPFSRKCLHCGLHLR